MSDILSGSNGSVDEAVAEVVDAFVQQLKEGHPPEIEEVARQHPHIADILRQVLPALPLLRPLSGSEPDPDSASVAEVGAVGSCLGDYRILGELGRGGMGVVYQAEQISLKRPVALKVLPQAATLDSKQRQRFQNEAQAAASLQHAHIVPVYAIGCERGIHFYAMQLVEGLPLTAIIQQRLQQESKQQPAGRQKSSGTAEVSLASTSPRLDSSAPDASSQEVTTAYTPAALPRTPSAVLEGKAESILSVVPSAVEQDYYRWVAQLGVQAAEALDHAHQMGVVHRDVKPGNLLLDSKGHLWVTDFGLAQVRQQEGGLTQTGDIVGTIRYMSPEQALAQRDVIDQRTDVYSLGATLYELLTLQAAFTSTDRQELLRQVISEEPSKPRQLRKSIPVDLETIILKAMEKRPQDRYATAKELADDLQRFLEDKPIRARLPGLTLRVRKWCRRHRPAVTGVIASVVLTLVASSVLIAVAYQQERKHRKTAEDAQAEEERQREQAEDQLYFADMGQASHVLAFPDMGRLRDILEAHRPREGQRDRRGWEWYYLRGLCDRELLSIQEDSSGNLAGLSMSWVGRDRLQVARQGCLRVWELNEQGKAASVRWRREGVASSSAWSPDGIRLAWVKAGQGATPAMQIQIEDGGSGRVIASLPTSHFGNKLAWSPDGRRLAAWAEEAGTPRRDGEARPILTIWDAPTSKALATCRTTDPLPKGQQYSDNAPLVWSPDGKLLAEAGDVLEGVPTVRIWEADSGREVRLLRLDPEGAASSVLPGTFVWNGKRLVAAVSGRTTGPHPYPATHLAWSPDSKRLAVVPPISGESESVLIQILDVATGQRLLSLPGSNCVTWSPDGASLAIPSASPRPAVVVWDATTGQERFTLRGHNGYRIDLVAWSPDGRRLASFDFANGLIKVWDVAPGPDYPLVAAHTSAVQSVAWNPDGKRLLSVADMDGTVKVWSWDRKEELFAVKRESGAIGAAWSPDGRRLAVFSPSPVPGGWVCDNRRIERHPLVMILDGQTGKQLQTLYGSIVMDGGTSHHPLSWSPDGSQLVCQSIDNHLKTWDVASGKEIVLFPSKSQVSLGGGSAWSPNGRWLALRGRDFTLLCDPTRPADCQVFPLDLEPRGTWTWSPDGGRLALFDSSGALRILAIPDGRDTGSRLKLSGGRHGENCAVWSPGGDRLALAGANETLQVWEPSSGRELLRLASGVSLTALSWSPDGQRLAAGGQDGTVRVWDASRGYAAGPFSRPGEVPQQHLTRAQAAHFQALFLQDLGRHAEAEAALVEAASELEGLVHGDDPVQDAPMRLAEVLVARAKLLRHQQRYAAAARCYREAFATYPAWLPVNLYDAAGAAAQAGCGLGQDAGGMEDKERADLRKQTLTWLKAPLQEGRDLLDSGLEEVRPAIPQMLAHLREDPDFSCVRGPEALAKLPEAERREWGKLWEEVADLLARAQGKSVPEAEVHFKHGNDLFGKGQLDEAIVEWREAIRIKKDYALAHCHLGLALLQKGQFPHAVEELRLGHQLGSRNPRWPHPSAQWLREAEQLVQLDERLSAVLQGKGQPKDTAECINFAQLCVHFRKRHAAAARWFGEAFTAQPSLADDLTTGNRYNAACAAALAGCGQAKDAGSLDDKQRARLRQQALDWLRADLKTYRQMLEKAAAKVGPAIVERMQHWLQDNDLAGVRGEKALARLPEAERKDWRKLWKEAEALRQQAAQPPKTASSTHP